MNKRILNFLKKQRIGILAVEMLDGSPHGATLHFAHTENPLVFYFETNKDYRKSESLLKKSTARASFVVGSDENNMQTLQLDGIVRMLKDEEKEIFESVYLGKFLEKKEKARDPKIISFAFLPSWWRFTDWTSPKGKVIITSEDTIE